MNPELRRELDEIKQMIRNIRMAEDIMFIEQIARRLESRIDARIALTELNDLADVNTSGVTNGQVIKYTSGTWGPADDLVT